MGEVTSNIEKDNDEAIKSTDEENKSLSNTLPCDADDSTELQKETKEVEGGILKEEERIEVVEAPTELHSIDDAQTEIKKAKLHNGLHIKKTRVLLHSINLGSIFLFLQQWLQPCLQLWLESCYLFWFLSHGNVTAIVRGSSWLWSGLYSRSSASCQQ